MENILIFHSQFDKTRNSSKGPRITVAARVQGDRMVFSASRCGENDNFCKAKGREVATTRLNASQFASEIEVSNEKRYKKAFIREAKRLSKIIAKNSHELIKQVA